MKARILAIAALLSMLLPSPSFGQEDCLECHETKKEIISQTGAPRSIYVDEDALKESPHAGLKCLECHPDAKLTVELDLDMEIDISKPLHKYPFDKVSCGGCHKSENFEYKKGAHGKAQAMGAPDAPTCRQCHGDHAIKKANAPNSMVNRANSPFLCGKCHSEGAPIRRGNDVTELNVADNFPEKIHGKSFFEKGLAVAATCVDCHGAHRQLKSTEPDSAVSRRHIMDTCSSCHLKIGPMHENTLQVALWKEKPWALPSCVTCHKPHSAQREAPAPEGVADTLCAQCHDGEGTAPHVPQEKIKNSVHKAIACASCHSDVDPKLEDRPCAKAHRVDCAHCHSAFGAQYAQSVHGQALEAGTRDAPHCSTCHGAHDIQLHLDETSPTFKSAIPSLCGRCHGGPAPPASISTMGAKAVADYSTSVHGKEVLAKGHMAPAVCTDCHSSHGMRKSSDPASTVYKDNIPTTCGGCHKDIYTDYSHSAHFADDGKKGAKLPTCADCHSAHTIFKVTGHKFSQEINYQCGGCHQKLAQTYQETIHGKIHKLGYDKAAKCSDCHMAHIILPASDPRSSVAKENLASTCGKCHKQISRNFTGFIPHADYHSMEDRPFIYYTYWFMTLLLFGVFGFFGVHTLLWLPRSLTHALFSRKVGPTPTGRYIRRFELRHRITHILVIISFLSLALTGMALKYSYQPWAQTVAWMLGGVAAAGFIHRVAAIITFGYFIYHIRALVQLKRKSGLSWLGFTFGPDSMMFNLNDIRQFWRTVKWFTWLGPRPDYGRFTYWEKFDYFAVFWGVPIIGISGLVLWFPFFFTQWLPGWIINLAMVIHSDEALLAVGFIFTIHFFNTHLRPDSFPMDPVIFTGLTPEEKYMEERSMEYAALKESGRLEEVLTDTPWPPKWRALAYAAGALFLGTGILLIILIIKAALSG